MLVLKQQDTIMASVMVGHDGYRGAIYYLAGDPAQQRQGLGARMIAEAENWLKRQGVWKLNLMVRQENTRLQNIYARLGFSEDRVVALSKRLEPMPYIDRTVLFGTD